MNSDSSLPREPINIVPVSVIEQSIRTAVIRLLRAGLPITYEVLMRSGAMLRAGGQAITQREMLDMADRIKVEVEAALYRPKLARREKKPPKTQDHVREYRDAWDRIRGKKP